MRNILDESRIQQPKVVQTTLENLARLCLCGEHEDQVDERVMGRARIIEEVDGECEELRAMEEVDMRLAPTVNFSSVTINDVCKLAKKLREEEHLLQAKFEGSENDKTVHGIMIDVFEDFKDMLWRKSENISKLHEQCEFLQGRLAEMTTRIEEANHLNSSPESQLATSNEEKEARSNNSNDLRLELGVATISISDFEDQRDELKMKILKLTNRLDEVQMMLDGSVQRVKDLKGEVSGLRNQLQQAKRTTEKLKTQIADIQREKQDLEER